MLLNCFVLLPMTPWWTIKCVFIIIGIIKFLFWGNFMNSDKKERKNIETIRDYEQCCQTFIPPHMFQVHLYQALKMLFCWKIFSWFHRWKITYRNLLKSLNYEYLVSFMPTIMNAKYKTKLQVIKDKQRMSFWREYFNIQHI